MRSEEEKIFYKKYYGQLIGAKILAVDVVEDEDGMEWPTLHTMLDSGGTNQSLVKLEVSRDEEGNGPGFLFGLPIPKDEDE